MKNTKKFLALALASVMAVSVAACGSSSSTNDTSAADSSTTTEAADTTASADGYNLAVCLASEPMTIDPALNSAVDGAIMTNHMFEGLVKWVDNGSGEAELAPGQAESWEKTVNDDGTVTYAIKMRDGIKWSDGKDVTAGDFEYSWKRLADPATAADYCYMIDMVQGYAEVADGSADKDTLGIKAVDDKNLEITLSYDCPYFEEIMAFPATFPVRQDMVESSDNWTFDPSTYIGNGPYKMTEWSHNAYISMEKNENYYDYANLGPDTITFKLMDDSNAMLSGFKSGELDYIQEAPQAELPNLIASGDMKIVDYLGTYYVCFQTQKAPFDNPKVREAFTLAVDRNYIVEKVTQSGQVEAGAYVPSGISDAEEGSDFRKDGGDYYDPTKDAYEANCEKARQLLAEAGYPNGEGFPVVEYLYNTNDAHKAVAEALQNMWEQELGVTVTLNNQEWNAFLQTRKDGDFSIARNGWISDYNDPVSFLDMWVTGGGNNDAQYANPDYDNLISQAKAESDPAARMKLLHQAEDILVGQDYVVDPLYFYTQKYMLRDGIEGMYYTPLGYFFFGYCTQSK